MLQKVLELEEKYFAALNAYQGEENPEYVKVWVELDAAYADLKAEQGKPKK